MSDTDNVQATELPQCDGGVQEQWLCRTVGHSWLVAFHSGRLFNAVRFHILQAIMLFRDPSRRVESDQECKMAVAYFDLWRNLIDIAGPARVSILRRIAWERERFLTHFAGEDHKEHAADYAALDPEVTFQTFAEAYLQLPNYDVLDSLKRMSETLDRKFPRRQRDLFRLGRHVDTAVRPADVYWRVLDESLGALSHPAELKLDSTWAVELSLWLSTALPNWQVDQTQVLAIQQSQNSAQHRVAAIDRLDATIRDYVVELPEDVVKDIPEVSLEPLQIRFQGDTYPLDESAREAALFLRVVVNAEGDWISPRKAREREPKLVGSFVPGRLIKMLPVQLRPFLKSERSNGTRLVTELLS